MTNRLAIRARVSRVRLDRQRIGQALGDNDGLAVHTVAGRYLEWAEGQP